MSAPDPAGAGQAPSPFLDTLNLTAERDQLRGRVAALEAGAAQYERRVSDLANMLQTSRQACKVASARVLELEEQLEKTRQTVSIQNQLYQDLAEREEAHDAALVDLGAAERSLGAASVVGFMGCIARDYALDEDQQRQLGEALLFTAQGLYAQAGGA